ncbi:hypothetical protein [Streptomyces sp. x-80]|uniref:hypothetical protein n=1 Tax=Streptomyces sp. x-80 TaxID=2789282 RepID=UPI00397FD5BA
MDRTQTPPPSTLAPRRLIAAGTTRHHAGRTITVRATAVGVTGTITRGGAR